MKMMFDLWEGDYVVGVDLLDPESYVLTISEKGYGKATRASEYAIRRRGGKGIKAFKIVERNGSLVGLKTIRGDEEILLITTEGVIIRFESSDISITGRDTQGVRLMRLDEEHLISTLSIVEPEEEDEEIERDHAKEIDSEDQDKLDELIEQSEMDDEEEKEE